ncbi:MAG: hypothetical protein KJ718_02175 [Nanoarchaeota archaeon]|nr:hypothetical protein [Nanoarchaeota archaeon]MBU1051341.1 hypothetical protein [Nanoarchaeota archaeon]
MTGNEARIKEMLGQDGWRKAGYIHASPLGKLLSNFFYLNLDEERICYYNRKEVGDAVHLVHETGDKGFVIVRATGENGKYISTMHDVARVYENLAGVEVIREVVERRVKTAGFSWVQESIK